MAKYSAVCEYVHDGATFHTAKQNCTQLARYNAPEKDEPGYDESKRLLSNLILNKEIVYEQVGVSYDRMVSEVWQAGANVNNIMINSGHNK